VTWDQQDVNALNLIGSALGPIRVLKIEENRMTEQDSQDWNEEDQAAPAPGGATYPEYPYSLADHVYTWSPRLPDGSMMVIRSNTAEGLAEATEALAAVTGRLRAAWAQATGVPVPVNQFPAQTAPPFGPNVSVPQAPGYQGPPVPAAPQWGGAPQPPAQPQWGGQQAAQGQRKEYPAPQGWYRLTGQKAQVDTVAQLAGVPKGNPGKGGMYNFFGLTPSGQPGKAWYCDPQVAQVFAQLNPVVG
jgi:hypothetical protein